MRFAQPLWLLVGLLACAFVAWRYRRFDLRQRASLAQFAAARLLDRLTASVSMARRNTKRALFVAGLAFIFVALARPQAGYVWEETHRKGLELLFAVDTSKSMLSEDVKPNRLTRAKLAVHDLLDKLDGDGVGLIAFAGNAFLQCPITLDYDAFRESLDAVDTNTIPRGGTDIAAAIREAQATFKTRTANEKILVLMTDGEDLEAEGIAAAQEAAKDGVKIFTVGVGTTAGELVPMGPGNGSADFVRDDQGNLVKSHLDETTLRAIASATGGMYQPLGAQGQGLDKIYEDGLAHFTRHDLASRRAKVYLEQFHWALLAALACLVSSMLIGNRRKTPASKPIAPPTRKSRRTSPRVAKGSSTLSGLRSPLSGLALALLTPLAVQASPQTAEQAYHSGDFGKAEQDYAATAAKQPAKPELQFNTGSAAYKAGDYAKAAEAFQKTIAASDVPVQQSAYYNLGNTQYRSGEKTEKKTPQETIKTWESAIKSYDAALQINASDADAKHNRDLVQRKLDQLKKQEQQKKDQQQQNQDKDKKDQQNQSGQQQKQDSKGSKGDSKNQKDQKSDAQNKQGGGKDQQNQPQNADAGKKDKQDSKDQKGADKNQQAKADKQDKKNPGQPQDKPGDHPSSQANQPSVNSGADSASAKDHGDTGQTEPGGKRAVASEAAAADERREPGQMTKQEARQLLDSLRADERRLPATSKSRGLAGAKNNQPLKDW